jgi:hypothetical protein
VRSRAEFSLPLKFKRLMGFHNLSERFRLVVHRFPPSMTHQKFWQKNGKDKAAISAHISGLGVIAMAERVLEWIPGGQQPR